LSKPANYYTISDDDIMLRALISRAA